MEEATPKQEAALEEVYTLEREAYQHDCAGDIKVSFDLRRQAIKLEEKILGLKNDDLAISLSSLAIDLYRAKQYDESEALFRRSLAIYQTSSGAESLHVSDELQWLAYVYDDRRQYFKALQLFSRSLRLRRKNLGPDYKQKAQLLSIYADLLRVTGRRVRAQAMKARAEKARARQRRLKRAAHTE